MTYNRKWDFVTYPIIFTASILLLFPILKPGLWYKSHAWGHTLALLDHFRNSFLHGNIYPGWLPELFGGYGCPTFLFYPPGFFFIALPFSFTSIYPGLTHQITLVLLFFLGGAGAYTFILKLSDHITALFCSLLYLFTPYIYVNLYVRGDLSELTGMLLIPWPFYFLVSLRESINKQRWLSLKLWGIAIAVLFVMLSHPVPAFLFSQLFIVITIFLTFEIEKSQRGKFLLLVFISYGMGLVLSSPYWFTFIQMKQYVNMNAVFQEYLTSRNHVVYFPQLFTNYWGFGASAGGPNDQMSFQLGLPHFLLALIGAAIGRKNKIVQASFLSYITFIVLMTPLATIFWEKAPLYNKFQFPWRTLSIIAILQIICISGIFKLNFKNVFVKICLMLIVLVAIVLWHSKQFQTDPEAKPLKIEESLKAEKEIREIHFITHSQTDEFVPLIAIKNPPVKPRRGLPLFMAAPLAKIRPMADNSSFLIHYEVSSQQDTIGLINQIYLPGWRVTLDKKDISPGELEKRLTDDGRMVIAIPKGEKHIVKAYYDGPPGWRIRNLIILILLVMFFVYTLKLSRKDANN